MKESSINDNTSAKAIFWERVMGITVLYDNFFKENSKNAFEWIDLFHFILI